MSEPALKSELSEEVEVPASGEAAEIASEPTPESLAPEPREDEADATPRPTAVDTADDKPTLLEVQGLCLTLGKRVVLDEVGFTVGEGEIVGLMGPNGSGKTSLMRCLTGLLQPERGTFRLGDQPLTRHGRADMGVVFQEPSLDPKLSALENLTLGANLFGIRGKEARTRSEELLEFMGLADRARDPVDTFSGGMKRRLELARALINRPKILLLDEPTVGLDPAAFEKTWQRLSALQRHQDLAIFVSTHAATEAERCDRLVVLDRGHVVASETPSELLSRVSGDVVELEVHNAEDIADALREEMELAPRVEGNVVTLELENGHEWIPRLVEALPPGIVKSVSMRRPTVADAFVVLTGHSLDVDEP